MTEMFKLMLSYKSHHVLSRELRARDVRELPFVCCLVRLAVRDDTCCFYFPCFCLFTQYFLTFFGSLSGIYPASLIRSPWSSVACSDNPLPDVAYSKSIPRFPVQRVFLLHITYRIYCCVVFFNDFYCTAHEKYRTC